MPDWVVLNNCELFDSLKKCDFRELNVSGAADFKNDLVILILLGIVNVEGERFIVYSGNVRIYYLVNDLVSAFAACD